MHTIKHKQQGNILLKAIIFLPGTLILLALAYFGFCEARKAYWDNQVKLMCEKDGGVKVYERTQISKEYIDKDGVIRLRSKPKNPEHPLNFEAQLTDNFYYDLINEPIKKGNIAVSKSTLKVIRTADRKILGEMVVYSRSGGDFIVIDHPSSFFCPNSSARPDILDLIFIK